MTDEDFKDTRTREQRIGAIPTRAKGITPKAKSPATVARAVQVQNNAEKALRLHVKNLIAEMTPQVVLNLYDIAINGKSESARVDACKVFIQSTVGRPSTVHVGADGAQIAPHFTIVFGEQPTLIQGDSIDISEDDNEF